MKSIIFKPAPTPCAFHQHNLISHFCRTQDCLLPLCKDCLPIHRREHASKPAPIDVVPIEEQAYAVHRSIVQQIGVLDDAFTSLSQAIKDSNQLHIQLRIGIFAQRQNLTQAIVLYYDSLLREVELNFQRRHQWFIQVTRQYHSARLEISSLQERLHGEKHLRTIIMWNRLKPQQQINEISRQAEREFEPPSLLPCDAQKVISFMSQMQAMTVLDLQGDLGFAKLEKMLYTLRYGPQESNVSTVNQNKTLGITLISKGKPTANQKLTFSKSSQRF